MEQYQHDFIEFLLQQNALLFGTFTLKSGRVSPYFFNSGQFNTAYALSQLGKFYAAAFMAAKIETDILFGPAYKGIPIISSVAIALYEIYKINLPFCFNRKETKAYGEGGQLIGSPLKGRVLIVDDVVSAGTTFRESAHLIAQHPATLVGVVTALDREEKGTTELSAIEEIEQNYHIKAITIVKLQHIVEYLKEKPKFEPQLEAILLYQQQYGSDQWPF